MKKLKILIISIICLSLASCSSSTINGKNADETLFEKNKQEFIKKASFQEKLDGKLSFGLVGEPENLNPFYYNDESSKAIVNTLYNPLFRINESNLEESYEFELLKDLTISEDNLTYTLNLRDAIYWDDGEKLDVNDLIFTINYAIENKDTKYLNSFFIDGNPITLNKVDDYTLNITLPRISSSFIYDLSEILVVPEHIYSKEPSMKVTLDNNEYLVGNSSYMFKDISIDDYFNTKDINFVKNDHFYDDNPKINNLKYRIVAHYDTPRYDMLDYNIQGGYIPGYDESSFENEAYNIEKLDEGQVVSFLFKTNSTYGGNQEIRNALSNVINPYSLLGNFGNDSNVSVANSIFSKSNEYRINDSYTTGSSQGEAINYLKEFQLKDKNFKLRYGFIMSAGEIQEKVAVTLQELFVANGINFELVPLYEDEYYEMLNDQKENKVDFCLYTYDSNGNPQFYKNYFSKESSLNYSGYANEELDKLWLEADSTTDKLTELKIYGKIQNILYSDKPILPVLYLDKILTIDDRIEGLEEAQPNSKSFFNNLNLLSISEFSYSDKDLEKFDLKKKDLKRKSSYDNLNIQK